MPHSIQINLDYTKDQCLSLLDSPDGQELQNGKKAASFFQSNMDLIEKNLKSDRKVQGRVAWQNCIDTSDLSLVVHKFMVLTLSSPKTPFLTNGLKFCVVFLYFDMSQLRYDKQFSLQTVEQVNLDKWYAQKEGLFTKKKEQKNWRNVPADLVLVKRVSISIARLESTKVKRSQS